MKTANNPSCRNSVGLGKKDLLAAIGLALVAAMIILRDLGSESLASWDEAVHGVVTRELLAYPQLTLQYAGIPWFDKPPFLFWLMAATSSVFGLTELALRLPVAICGISATVITYVVTRRLGSRASGLMAAVLLLGVPQFVAYSRLAMTDVPLVTLGMLSIALMMYGENQPPMSVAAGVAFGLALLTKSIAAFLFLPGIMAIMIARRGVSGLWSKEILLLVAAALAVALPWYLWSTITHGRSFIDQHLLFHVTNRVRPLESHQGFPFYYLHLYRFNAGWFALIHAAGIFAAAWLAVREQNRMLGALVILPLGAFLVVNTQATKIGWYLTPVYGGAAIASALAITRFLRSGTARSAAVTLLALLALPGVIHGRGSFVEEYNILDYSPEVRSLRSMPPFLNSRVPLLYVVKVADPAPRFYLAAEIRSIDEDELKRLVQAYKPFLCLTFKWLAVDFVNKHPQAGLGIIASTESLALIGRHPN